MSVLVLAAASLIAIPAMIAASGKAAWGMIALGQVIGAIGAIAVGYGWGWFGPARIARYSATGRRTEYIESIVTRAALTLPVSAVAAVIAYSLAPTMPLFAVAGAISATSVGLTANWYFIGLARPFTMLVLDTFPRAAGTAAGVLLMYEGHSAILGPLGMFFGMLAAFVLSTIWILWDTKRNGAEPCRTRPILDILMLNRAGVASALCFATYNAAPLAIVSLVAPGVQPAFALVNRIDVQIHAASAPVIMVLQGWVPRGAESTRVRRADIALVSACTLAVVLAVATIILAPYLVDWLGSEQVSVSTEVVLLMSICVSVTLFKSALERAALATFDELRIVAIALAIGSLVGLPLVGVGAIQLGTAGALVGVLAGLLVCVTIELIAYVRRIRPTFHGGRHESSCAAP
ncbi:hypothetical protein ABQF17_07290 [Mycolicibacterium elephantis]